MDRGYDNNRVYDECHERGVAPVIPPRKGRTQPPTPIQRGTQKRADLYRRRTSVEREFGRLKHDYGLAFLRVRGIERVRLHADLTILARLALAVSRERRT
jgi:transposase